MVVSCWTDWELILKRVCGEIPNLPPDSQQQSPTNKKPTTNNNQPPDSQPTDNKQPNTKFTKFATRFPAGAIKLQLVRPTTINQKNKNKITAEVTKIKQPNKSKNKIAAGATNNNQPTFSDRPPALEFPHSENWNWKLFFHPFCISSNNLNDMFCSWSQDISICSHFWLGKLPLFLRIVFMRRWFHRDRVRRYLHLNMNFSRCDGR